MLDLKRYGGHSPSPWRFNDTGQLRYLERERFWDPVNDRAKALALAAPALLAEVERLRALVATKLEGGNCDCGPDEQIHDPDGRGSYTTEKGPLGPCWCCQARAALGGDMRRD